ncbi:MAG TPA: hypothetical protein VGO36_03490 [Solirubrobacterales bacterium]|jgi:hypothetical protein|nr:hypothetical protein [Solirubrobacterales bacterium]
MPTYIRFSEDHSVVVLESFEEIGKRIREAEAASIPLFEVTRADGPKLLVNAGTIRTVSEGKKKDGDRKG